MLSQPEIHCPPWQRTIVRGKTECMLKIVLKLLKIKEFIATFELT